MFRAKRRESIIGELSKRCRNVDRSCASRGRSPARWAAIATYSRALRATSSGRARFDMMVRPPRETAVFPARQITGTPIMSASRLVVTPLYGVMSRAMSIR